MASPSQIANGTPTGQLQPFTPWGDFSNLMFLVQQALCKMQTATLVKIVSCTNDGGLSPVGFVDVIPMVNQIDGISNPTPHGTIYGLPYFRIQGGANAIIMDPAEGDIGICVFASRDISKVKSTKAQANPGSFRTFNFADGMYLGGTLNGTPSQYIQFSSAGINIVSPLAIKLQAPTVETDAPTAIILNGPTSQGQGSNPGGYTVQGPLNVIGDVTADGISLETHVHTGVEPGGGDSGPPL